MPASRPMEAPLERKKVMTADFVRTVSTYVAALFVSTMLVAATTSTPGLW